jgi:hypothetical protein
MVSEIEKLKASIEEKEYDWTPAETSVSKLSEAEQKDRLGLLKQSRRID